MSPPEPPTSSLNGMPGSPSSTIFFHVSTGKRCEASISAASGATSVRANSRTMSRIMSCCSDRSSPCWIEGSVMPAMVIVLGS